ncbi:MAG: hypothetical protein ACW99A_13820 [Candidatus Kariarchaeaceae archaeon]|jgi:beta-lactamase regulating signal transducer with metallopeptidase domain
MLGKLSVISGIIAFTSSVSWLIINLNQPNGGSSDTIDRDRQINDIQNTLSIIWLIASLLAIILTIVVFLNRSTNTPDGEVQTNTGNVIVAGMSFVVISPHFVYFFMILMLDIIFRGI